MLSSSERFKICRILLHLVVGFLRGSCARLEENFEIAKQELWISSCAGDVCPGGDACVGSPFFQKTARMGKRRYFISLGLGVTFILTVLILGDFEKLQKKIWDYSWLVGNTSSNQAPAENHRSVCEISGSHYGAGGCGEQCMVLADEKPLFSHTGDCPWFFGRVAAIGNWELSLSGGCLLIRFGDSRGRLLDACFLMW